MKIKFQGRLEKIAVAVSSWIISKFTSDNYKKFIRIEDRPHPPNWWEDRRNLSG